MFLNTLLTKFLKRIKFFLFFSFLCFISFTVIFFVNRFFLVKNIQLISEKKIVLVNQDKLINKSLLFANQDQISKKIIEENHLLKTAVIEKIWPDTLKITISFYEQCASLVINNGLFNLSCDGRILQKIQNTQQNLPVINYYQKLNSGFFQTGDWIDYKDIKQALFFVERLKQINIFPLTIDIKGQDMLVFNLIGTKKIIFSNSKDKEVQSYQLELIIKQFKIEGKDYNKIDLRFDKPIVSF